MLLYSQLPFKPLPSFRAKPRNPARAKLTSTLNASSHQTQTSRFQALTPKKNVPTATHPVQQLYPLRYWLAVAYAVGIPNFIHFDPTGLTHNYGLFNLTSLSAITLTLSTAFLLLVITLLTRRRLLLRRVDIASGLWIGLFLTFVAASLLQPASRLVPYSSTDIPLSLYRLCEWLLAFALFLSLYTRARPADAPRLIIGIMARACWINLAIVWLVLPIAPSLAYCSEDAAPGSPARLGGVVIHPGDLALLSSVVFFHALLFLKGSRRVLACAFALLTISLTYGRSAQVIFLATLFVYLIVLSRKPALQWASVGLVLAGLVTGVIFQDRVIHYISRGQSASDVTSLSDRTVVWQASFQAIAQRPVLGYGFIAGAKNALRDQWLSSHWVPPHAHNELIQALLSGGIPALLLVLAIYLQALWFAARAARHSLQGKFFLMVLIQLIAVSFVATILTTQFTRVSALFVLCFLGVVAPARAALGARKRFSLTRRTRAFQPAPRPSLNPSPAPLWQTRSRTSE